MQEHQRFARLQHLLQKSSIYSQFLLQRMEKQKEEEEDGKDCPKPGRKKKAQEVSGNNAGTTHKVCACVYVCVCVRAQRCGADREH